MHSFASTTFRESSTCEDLPRAVNSFREVPSKALSPSGTLCSLPGPFEALRRRPRANRTGDMQDLGYRPAELSFYEVG
jgi:hypothetical protein